MKKLIVLSVVFALMIGSVFAVDLSGAFFGSVNLIEGDSSGGDVQTSANFNRVRLEASGSAADGAFGAWIRSDKDTFAGANVWWKPIDQFKMIIGNNGGDGWWGKEGVTGWGFNQIPYDAGIALGGGNIWGGGYASTNFRNAFFGGLGDSELLLEITPVDMFGVNIALPVFKNDKTENVFKGITAQVNVNLDIGNIAITYAGEGSDKGDGKGALYAYFGGSFGDLSLDVGIGYHFKTNAPFYVGAGVKYATESFGVKFRATAAIPTSGDNLSLIIDVNPYYSISESLCAFVNAGIGMDTGSSTTNWFVNPYLRVGAEWGPSFYIGAQFGTTDGGSTITYAIPIALVVNF